MVNVPLIAIPAGNVRVGICGKEDQELPLPFLGKQLAKDSESRSIEMFRSKDRGRVTGVTNDFRVVIKGDKICDEIGAGGKGINSVSFLGKSSGAPLRKVYGGGRNRRTSAPLSTTRTSRHGTTKPRGIVSYHEAK